MKRTAYLILALLTLPAVLTAGNLSVGLGYPYVSAKYDGEKLAAEARMVTGGGVQVYAGRGYWSFYRKPALRGFTGLEAGYIRFDTLSMKGTGYEASLFIGGEYPVADNFYVLMDFAPTLIVLRHDLYTDVRVGGMEYVVNLGFYYRFGRKGGKTPAEKKQAAAAPAPAVKVSTAAAAAIKAPPQVSTAAVLAAEAVDVDALLKQLYSRDWKERRKAAFELGKVKSPRAVEPLIGILDDKNERVRGVAALALGRLGDPRALLPLMLTLSDPSTYVRASVAKSLGQLKDKRALMDLEDAAKDLSEEVSKAAKEAMQKITGAAAKKTVLQNVAVAEFTGKNVSQADASIVADFLRTELVNTGLYNVMDRNNMDAVLAEQKLQNSGCTDQECAVQMGMLLNVTQIMVGSLSRLAENYYITVNVVDVKTGKITASYNSEAVNSKGLKEACQRIVEQISEK